MRPSIPLNNWLHLVMYLLASASFPMTALCQIGEPPSPEQRSGEQTVRTISAPSKRVLFDLVPFSAGSTVPYWDKGYLVSISPETAAPGTVNVRLYDANGKKAREAAVWFPEAKTVFLGGAAITSQGTILVSGTAVKADGTRAYYIAATDVTGKLTDAIQTNPFFPKNTCSTADGSVWSFGELDSSGTPVDGNILRHFDFHAGMINSFLPRSSFSPGPYSPALRGNEGHEVYVRCLSNKVFIYSGTADEYIEFDTSTGSAQRFRIDRSAIDLPVRGFAVTEQGDVYGYLRDYQQNTTVQGLFHLDVNTATGRVRWTPIVPGSGLKGQAGVISGLWGADGEYLVHGFDSDPSGRAAVSWSLPTK
jgi:hypothetical protein